MIWFFILFFLSYRVSGLEADRTTLGQKNSDLPSTVVVVGTVYCDTCFLEGFSKSSHFISGAYVAVECSRNESSNPSFRRVAKTNEHGEFKIPLPSSVSKHVRRIKRCSVKLIKSSEPNCAVASTATSSSLHLKSRKQGTHIFSAGFFTFKPLNQPNLCNQKPSQDTATQLNSNKVTAQPPPTSYPFPFPPSTQDQFPPPIQDSTPPSGLPQLPFLPRLPPLPQLPQLPPLPPLPRLPSFPSMPGKNSKFSQLLADRKAAQPRTFFPLFPMPPNPFLPAPGGCPQKPFQPPPICPPSTVRPPPGSPLFPVSPPISSVPTTPYSPIPATPVSFTPPPLPVPATPFPSIPPPPRRRKNPPSP